MRKLKITKQVLISDVGISVIKDSLYQEILPIITLTEILKMDEKTIQSKFTEEKIDRIRSHAHTLFEKIKEITPEEIESANNTINQLQR